MKDKLIFSHEFPFIEYTDVKKIASDKPGIFYIATRKSKHHLTINKGFISSNPYKIFEFDREMPLLDENEIILFLDHEHQTKEELLPILLKLMEYHPINYYDLDTNKPLEDLQLRAG